MTRSMTGCSAAMAADAALYLDRQVHGKRRQRPRALPPARAVDALPAGTCWRCGVVGEHVTAAACIDALRERLARFE